MKTKSFATGNSVGCWGWRGVGAQWKKIVTSKFQASVKVNSGPF